jgi:hypothetical protein
LRAAAAQVYFPPSALSETSEVRYTQTLRALGEPSLFELSRTAPDIEGYRLLWLRESDRPVAIRFVPKSNLTGWFYRRVGSGKGFDPPAHSFDRGMSWSWSSRTRSFLAAIGDSGFWTMPLSGTDPATCRSHWILEGVRQGNYRIIDRCSPGSDDPIRIIGMRMIKLGSLRSSRNRVY